jgi:hypothetical protein
MRSLSFLFVIAVLVLGNVAALRAEDLTSASPVVSMSAVPAAGKTVRLAASPIPQGQEQGTNASDAKTGGACGSSGYTCGSRYPYCCYSDAKGYYCRQDARHC